MVPDTDQPLWSIPYIDQPPAFWDLIAERYGPWIGDVYFPIHHGIMGTGRPDLPATHLPAFLEEAALPKAVLMNSAVLPGPVEHAAAPVRDELRRLQEAYGVQSGTLANLRLAEEIREALPSFRLTASVLMDITTPAQALLLNEVFDVLVPGSGVFRNLEALRELKAAFHGKIRLLVNEGCLGGCPYRAQHFHEMSSGVPAPKSLCEGVLTKEPWLRLTGAWVVPQYLKHYTGAYDELKLAGRVTLQDPLRYIEVLHAFIHREPLLPSEIGGGPASVREPIDMPEDLYRYTLECGQKCHVCRRCESHYRQAVEALAFKA